MIQWLQGKKTYLLGLAALAYAIGGYFSGHLDAQTAMDIIWASLTSMALRAGISKNVQG
jgi:hypothetical protein